MTCPWDELEVEQGTCRCFIVGSIFSTYIFSFGKSHRLRISWRNSLILWIHDSFLKYISWGHDSPCRYRHASPWTQSYQSLSTNRKLFSDTPEILRKKYKRRWKYKILSIYDGGSDILLTMLIYPCYANVCSKYWKLHYWSPCPRTFCAWNIAMTYFYRICDSNPQGRVAQEILCLYWRYCPWSWNI